MNLWIARDTEGSQEMVIMSAWIQQKLASMDPLSSALFCLWLSTASLVPLFFMGMM
jgi:hypothetical protein